jgi:hypothetical protein
MLMKNNLTNLMNIKSLIVHALDSDAQAICNCDLYQRSHGYELTYKPVTCKSCLYLLELRKKKEPEKEEPPKRSIRYVLLKEFTPLNLLLDKTIPHSDLKKFHSWCVDNDIVLDQPMHMNKILVEKLDSLGCFVNWMIRRGYLKIEEIPVDLKLTFKNSEEYYSLIRKIRLCNDRGFQMGMHEFMHYNRLGPAVLSRTMGRFSEEGRDNILTQLLEYRHLFEKVR